MKRFTKNEVKYTDDHGTSSEQCSKCKHWLDSNQCAIVNGFIRPGGWCNQFKRKEQ